MAARAVAWWGAQAHGHLQETFPALGRDPTLLSCPSRAWLLPSAVVSSKEGALGRAEGVGSEAARGLVMEPGLGEGQGAVGQREATAAGSQGASCLSTDRGCCVCASTVPQLGGLLAGLGICLNLTSGAQGSVKEVVAGAVQPILGGQLLSVSTRWKPLQGAQTLGCWCGGAFHVLAQRGVLGDHKHVWSPLKGCPEADVSEQ